MCATPVRRARATGALGIAAAAVVAGARALALAGCGGEPPAPPRPNVIFILVDTLRAQNLSAYGYERDTSPNLAAFRDESFFFEDARSQAPCTFPSANSVLTSRVAPIFFGQPEGRLGIPEGVPSIAEILAAEGYATVAVSGSPIVRATPSKFNPHGGFGRGFDLFEERCVWGSAACINEHAFTFTGVLREPFFLYLHYMDPHGPFDPPHWWQRPFSDPAYEGPGYIKAGDPNPIADRLYAEPGRRPAIAATVPKADVEHLQDLYDDEIAFFDAQFKKLLRHLRETGLLDRSIVVLVADHGEEFLEHGHIKHCHSLYDTEIKTPMYLRVPVDLLTGPGAPDGAKGAAGPTGVRITQQVANLDVVPTLLDYLEIDPSPYRLDGRSLRPALERGEPTSDFVFAAWGSLRAAKRGDHKLVYNLASEEFRLYDLAADPGETENVLEREPEVFRELKRGLFAHLIETEGAGSREGSIAAGQEARDRLKALGYLQ